VKFSRRLKGDNNPAGVSFFQSDIIMHLVPIISKKASDFAGKEVRKFGYNSIMERDGRHKKMLFDFDLLLAFGYVSAFPLKLTYLLIGGQVEWEYLRCRIALLL